jgi:hypothetical protein
MSNVCWLEDRDDRLARARTLAPTDPLGALALVESVLAVVPDDPEALRAKGAVLVDVADAERDPHGRSLSTPRPSRCSSGAAVPPIPISPARSAAMQPRCASGISRPRSSALLAAAR